MIVSLLAAASVAAQAPPATATNQSVLNDASHAIDAGRLKEAKLLIARAISEGARGAPVDRLTADLAFASNEYLQALIAYQRLADSADKQPSDCEKGAIAALEIGRTAEAKPLAECAVASPDASWRAWNARGVVADFAQDWATADQSFARAHQLAPDEARVINNQGWSKLLRGDWSDAVP
jgi:Flp pilus assembly protein TadD